MFDYSQFINIVGKIINDLTKEGFKPILIGGMALVFLGSRRITRDFDFIISKESREQRRLIEVLYQSGLELASKVNDRGDIIQSISNKNVAFSRLQIDKPASAYFLHPKTGLRIDFLFDFPEPIEAFDDNVQKIKVQSFVFDVASTDDLIKLKKKAAKNRKSMVDQQDIEFLKEIKNESL
ncbi:MAG: hypothetical protein ABII18_13705 [bacterium]|nr:hypothetical protein [bacterium]MBU1918707.1 hypothetical protein [bacterium]